VPRTARVSIYYGRIRYVEPHPGQETFIESDPIRDAIAAARPAERYRHMWVIGNLEFNDDAQLVTGRLGYPASEELTQEEWDEETHQFLEKEFTVPDAVSGPFVLNHRKGAMAFEPGEIGPTGYVNHFAAVLTASGRGIFKGELVRVAQSYRDREFLSIVDKVTSVRFDVHPTNPRDRRIFRPLDEGMKAANAKRERVLIENQDEGLVLDPPDDRDQETLNPAVQGIEMVDEGYGESYRIDAEREDTELRFESKTGGLLRDVIEGVPEDPAQLMAQLREHLERRRAMLEPGGTQAPALEAADEEEETEEEAPPEETEAEGDDWEDER
jgi:hypothetical protein